MSKKETAPGKNFLLLLSDAQIIVLLAKLNPMEMFNVVSQNKADREYMDKKGLWKEIAQIAYKKTINGFVARLTKKQPWQKEAVVRHIKFVNYFAMMLAEYLVEEYSFRNGKITFSEILFEIYEGRRNSYESEDFNFVCLDPKDKVAFSVQYEFVIPKKGDVLVSNTVRVTVHTIEGGVYYQLLDILEKEFKYAPKSRKLPAEGTVIEIPLMPGVFMAMHQLRHLFYRILHMEQIYLSVYYAASPSTGQEKEYMYVKHQLE